MESSPEDNLPPLRGFNSEGEPIGVEPDEPPTDTEDKEFRTPAASESAGNYRLRLRAVSLSTRSRVRRNTTSSDRRVEPFPNRGCVRAALDRVRRLEHAVGESSSQDSRESLLWDRAAQSLGDPLDHKHLWSSSTTSTHFDVTVVKSESLPDEMATAGAEISEQDLLDAGPSGIQTGSAPAQRGDTDATGRSVDTVSLVSTDTIVACNIPTPLPCTSHPHTPQQSAHKLGR